MMRARLITAIFLLGASFLIPVTPSATAPGPTPFYIHNSTYNVTAFGETQHVTSLTGQACYVNETTIVGQQNPQFALAAVLTFSSTCAPTLALEDVTGQVQAGGSDFQEVTTAMVRDVINIPVTQSVSFLYWHATCPYTDCVSTNYYPDTHCYPNTSPANWQYYDPYCYSTVVTPGAYTEYISRWRFKYNGGSFSGFCATNCGHTSWAASKAYNYAGWGECNTVGEIPWGGSTKCVFQGPTAYVRT